LFMVVHEWAVGILKNVVMSEMCLGVRCKEQPIFGVLHRTFSPFFRTHNVSSFYILSLG
jgi:hypothetical protein